MILIDNTVAALDALPRTTILKAHVPHNPHAGVVVTRWDGDRTNADSGWHHPSTEEGTTWTTQQLVAYVSSLQQWVQLWPLEIPDWEVQLSDLRDQINVALEKQAATIDVIRDDLDRRIDRINTMIFDQNTKQSAMRLTVQDLQRQLSALAVQQFSAPPPQSFQVTASAGTHLQIPEFTAEELKQRTPWLKDTHFTWQPPPEEVTNEEASSDQNRGSGAAPDPSDSDTDPGDTGVLDSAG